MEYTLPDAPMEQLYSECDSMFDSFCTHCALPFLQCIHSAPQASYAAAQMLYTDTPHCKPLLPDPSPAVPDLAPLMAYIDTQPLMDENMWQINADETTVQPGTVQAHVEDIYTPGDRLSATKSGKLSHRRQAPRAGGFPCKVKGCGKTFDRACELNRHRKTHLSRSERPHKCRSCPEAFLYPKDLNRHQRKHVERAADQITYFCPYPGCHDLNGFSRRDNLLRHQRKQHASIVAAA